MFLWWIVLRPQLRLKFYHWCHGPGMYFLYQSKFILHRTITTDISNFWIRPEKKHSHQLRVKCKILLFAILFQVTCCQTDSCNSATFTSASDGTILKTNGFLLTLVLLISALSLRPINTDSRDTFPKYRHRMETKMMTSYTEDFMWLLNICRETAIKWNYEKVIVHTQWYTLYCYFATFSIK